MTARSPDLTPSVSAAPSPSAPLPHLSVALPSALPPREQSRDRHSGHSSASSAESPATRRQETGAGAGSRSGGERGTLLDARQVLRLYGMSTHSRGNQGPEPEDDLTLARLRLQLGLPGLVVRPAQVQGAAWPDGRLERSDLRADPRGPGTARRPGVALQLSFGVSQVTVGRCLPREGVRLDLWHADAQGRYANRTEPGRAPEPDGRATGRHGERGYDTRGQEFLRGFQLTGEDGQARFTTIYPGWTDGHAPQLHLRLQTLAARRVTGEFSTPLFFDDALSDRVYGRAAYRAPLERGTRNPADPQFRPALLLEMRGSLQAGLHAHIEIGLNI